MMTGSYAIVRLTPADRVDLETFAHAAGLHADLVRRLVALGLLDARTDAAGRVSLPLSQLAAVGRIQRLRAGLSLNYAALGLVIDLLDRIAELEAALRARPRAARSTTDSPRSDVPRTDVPRTDRPVTDRSGNDSPVTGGARNDRSRTIGG
jgi:hypothetical protein